MAADETLRELDALLWSFDPTAFIPIAGPAMGAPGEVLLVEDAALLQHRAVLLNLGDVVPPAAAEFARILEVVPSARRAVRLAASYREYQSLGRCSITSAPSPPPDRDAPCLRRARQRKGVNYSRLWSCLCLNRQRLF